MVSVGIWNVHGSWSYGRRAHEVQQQSWDEHGEMLTQMVCRMSEIGQDWKWNFDLSNALASFHAQFSIYYWYEPTPRDLLTVCHFLRSTKTPGDMYTNPGHRHDLTSGPMNRQQHCRVVVSNPVIIIEPEGLLTHQTINIFPSRFLGSVQPRAPCA